MKRWLKSAGALALVLALFSLGLHAPALDLPLDRDEGVYATIALAWQRGWGLPYRDFLDHKPPLLYALYALAFKLGGPSALALRVFSAVWQALTAASFGLLLRRWSGSQSVGLSGGLALAALSAAWGTQAVAANAEGWAGLPIILGLACLKPWAAQRQAWQWLAWGAAAGLAACIKQPFYLFALGLPLLLEAGAQRWRCMLWSTLGLLLAHAPLLLALPLAGTLGAWWHFVFAYHADYGSPLSWAALRGLVGLSGHLSVEQGCLWALALAGALLASKASPGLSLRRVGSVCLSLGLAASAISGRWYPHYVILWALGLALLMAALFQAELSFGWRRARAVLFVVALLVFARAQAPYWSLPDGASRSQRLYGTTLFAQAPAAAAWAQSTLGPDERLLIWGAEAEIYFLAQRRPAGRFLTHYGFSGENPAWPGAEAELFAAVSDARTKAVILCQPLDQAQPLQLRFGQALQKNFEIRRDPAFPFWVGLRRP